MELTLQDGVDHLKGLVDLLADLGTGEDNLAADEDEEHDFRLQYMLDEARITPRQPPACDSLENEP